jgi:ornithine decarboxylase
VNPYYAVKSNPEKLLLQTLASYGAGFDCASGKELEEVASLEFSPSEMKQRVVYANPCKPLRDLHTATRLGTSTTVIDSFEEVEKLSSFRWQGSSLIRIVVEDRGSLMPFSRKFGIHPSQVKDLSRFAKSKQIPIEGVSFHVGSGCKEKTQYSSAIQLAHDCMELIRKEGHSPSLVDIGGGFLSGESNEPAFIDYASVIRKSLDKSKGFRYIAEPGRFFSSSSFDLFVQVIGKKPTSNGNGWRYTIDDSLYGQFSCIPFDQKIPLWVRVPSKEDGSDAKPRKASPGILFGRTCDSLDMIAKSPSMEELEVGDWLWFPHMGAYSSVTASEFNGFPKPKIIDSGVQLPSLSDMAPHGLKSRLPFDVTTVNGVTLDSSHIPAVA